MRDLLLSDLRDKVRIRFLEINNPLGLMDSFAVRIEGNSNTALDPLYPFYEIISAVYRLQKGTNQLEILWNGKDHEDQYAEEWKAAFRDWTESFFRDNIFLQAVLDLTVFYPSNGQPQLAENRMQAFILRRFDLKWHKSKGMLLAQG